MRATPRPGVTLARPAARRRRRRAPSPPPRRRRPSSTARRTPSGDNRAPLLVVEKLVKEYPRKDLSGGFAKLFRRNGAAPAAREPATFRAVDGISFTVHRGESVGLVGESGCGKSTTSTMVMRLIDKSDGRIMFDGQDIGAIPGQEVRQAAAAQAHPDGVPGPHRQPQPALHGRARDRRSDPAAGQRQGRQGRCARAARSWRGRSGCRSSCSTASPTSSRAGRRRASASPAPSRSIPTSSSWTSRRRRSTCRCRRWCSTCCRSSRSSSA